MAQQRLDRARVGAMLQQVSCKAVAQSMRRNVAHAGGRGVTFDRGPRELPCQWLSAMQKKIR